MEPQEPVLKWVAFDLDDTLHSFRKASAEAMEAVYGYVYEEFGVLLDVQRQAYMDILAKGQSGNFIEDKPANDYRSERFGALLSSFNILPHIHLNMMLEIYDRALERTLEVKDGAHDLLRKLRAADISVMVVSEGPHDAQEKTLLRLGLAPYVNLLVTSSKEGICKQTGLLEKALEKAGCSVEEVIYVGDNLERDIVPAQAMGIRCILFSDQETNIPVPRITTLRTVEANLDAIIFSSQRNNPAAILTI